MYLFYNRQRIKETLYYNKMLRIRGKWYENRKITDEMPGLVVRVAVSSVLQSHMRWGVMRCGTKRFTIEYEQDGKRQTTEVQARTMAEARKQVRLICGGKVIQVKTM